MKKLLLFVTLAVLVETPFAAQSETMGTAHVGVTPGPRGYDWLLGRWTCVNKNPSPLAGPSTSTFTAVRATAGGGLFIRANGPGFDSTAYLTYLPKTRSWSTPGSFADGSSEIESSTGTGTKVTFTGTYTTPSGATTKVRDLYTFSRGRQVDVGQTQAGGVWKTIYTTTCTKT